MDFLAMSIGAFVAALFGIFGQLFLEWRQRLIQERKSATALFFTLFKCTLLLQNINSAEDIDIGIQLTLTLDSNWREHIINVTRRMSYFEVASLSTKLEFIERVCNAVAAGAHEQALLYASLFFTGEDTSGYKSGGLRPTNVLVAKLNKISGITYKNLGIKRDKDTRSLTDLLNRVGPHFSDFVSSQIPSGECKEVIVMHDAFEMWYKKRLGLFRWMRYKSSWLTVYTHLIHTPNTDFRVKNGVCYRGL